MHLAAALAVLALCCAAARGEGKGETTVMIEAAGYPKLHVPKQGDAYTRFVITSELADLAGNAPRLEYSIDFTRTDAKREIHVHPSIEGEPPMNPLIFDKSMSREVDIPLGNCTNGCTVEFRLWGDCGGTCVSDITTTQWIRTLKASGGYVYSNDALPYMPVYKGLPTPILHVNEGRYVYFTYRVAGDQEEFLQVEKQSDLGASVILISGRDAVTRPTQEDLRWTLLDKKAYRQFAVGNNYLAVYGTNNKINGDVTIIIGAAGPRAAPLLVLALLALLL